MRWASIRAAEGAEGLAVWVLLSAHRASWLTGAAGPLRPLLFSEDSQRPPVLLPFGILVEKMLRLI